MSIFLQLKIIKNKLTNLKYCGQIDGLILSLITQGKTQKVLGHAITRSIIWSPSTASVPPTFFSPPFPIGFRAAYRQGDNIAFFSESQELCHPQSNGLRPGHCQQHRHESGCSVKNSCSRFFPDNSVGIAITDSITVRSMWYKRNTWHGKSENLTPILFLTKCVIISHHLFCLPHNCKSQNETMQINSRISIRGKKIFLKYIWSEYKTE